MHFMLKRFTAAGRDRRQITVEVGLRTEVVAEAGIGSAASFG
jgi:hypothetical protein